jgi:hypothetical protein
MIKQFALLFGVLAVLLLAGGFYLQADGEANP